MTRVLLLIPILMLAACGGSDQNDTLPEEVYGVRGIYEGPRFEGAAVSVNHEAVPDLMGAMQMDFRLADTASVAHLTPGQKVRFHIAITPDGARAFGFERLPDDTRLQLAGMPLPADSADTAADAVPADTVPAPDPAASAVPRP